VKNLLFREANFFEVEHWQETFLKLFIQTLCYHCEYDYYCTTDMSDMPGYSEINVGEIMEKFLVF